jgi:ABC-type glutathione transport system ATPase component
MLLDADFEARYRDGRKALRRARFALEPGEILGLVGPSGAGKSTIALAVLGLLAWRGGGAAGRIAFRGTNLLGLRERDLRALRGREIAMVPQSPAAAFNPYVRLEGHFREAWNAHARGDWRARAAALLEAANLPGGGEFLRRFPAQVSVGQAQRVLIAMALLHGPALLVADEATSALDPISQAGVLELLAHVRRAHNAAILYISHDLASVAALCDRVAVLHDGEVVECGNVDAILRAPEHPYTIELVRAHRRLAGN